ncbi:hypothetical protein [Pacificoceanicola onchidii]|uniref:hypothetical protein n=1 Tax=Pacificoceanicola onchidii TaxID=2562685 RepID=UPI0010A5C317|nr:hypothetical protein [Pacificoceanicola onchidii]
MKAPLALVLCTLAGMAFADCAPEQRFLSCKIDGKARWLEVCVEGSAVVYRYGKPGAPELELWERAEDIAYAPWPGFGRTIWEEVTFVNGGYSYVVHGSIDKGLAVQEAPNAVGGGVEVFEGARSIARLTCDPETVAFDWSDAISMAKAAAGLIWDPENQAWRRQ